jgi:hypothetical protein
MVKIIKIVLKIAHHQTPVIMMAFVPHISVKLQRIVPMIVGHPVVIEMVSVKVKMAKILPLARMIVDVIMTAHANQNEEKIQILAPVIVKLSTVIMMAYANLNMARMKMNAQLTVNHPPVMKMAHVRGKTAKMKLTVPATAIHHLSVIIMEYVILENIGLHVETVHHAPWRSQTMTMLPMPSVF